MAATGIAPIQVDTDALLSEAQQFIAARAGKIPNLIVPVRMPSAIGGS
jgi:hypothetical protein